MEAIPSPNAALAEAARAVALRRLGGLRAPVAVTIYLDEHLEVERVAVELVAINGTPVRGDPPPGHHGRPAGGCGRDILEFVRRENRHFSDIMAAMRDRGHSETTARRHLKSLVDMGVVRHDEKGGPYTAAEADDA